MASLLRHGFFLQLSTLLYLGHFQLDRALVSAFAGLSEVARYEIGARPVQVLRTLPESTFRTFLPAVARRDPAEARDLYLEMTRTAGYAVVVFLLLPLTVAPFLLFTWAGEIGYHGRWVFFFLALALSTDLLTAPVSNFMQALGRPRVESLYALRGLTVHLVLAALLVTRFGKNAAAAACAIGIVSGHWGFVGSFHRLMGWAVSDTALVLWREFRPALVICAIDALAAAAIRPWVILSRWYMGPAAALLYSAGIGMVAFAYRDRLLPVVSRVLAGLMQRRGPLDVATSVAAAPPLA
jgi:hypothetical protein